MLVAHTILLSAATAAVAASSSFAFVKRADFPLASIPSVCDNDCTTYKNVFGTCPDSPSDSVCSTVCNGTVLTEFQVCIRCLQNNRDQNVTLYDIDLLNSAQQQLAQQCVTDSYPSTFSGTVVIPTTVTYPEGVDQGTIASNPTQASNSAATSSVSPTTSGNSAAASGSGSVSVSGSAPVASTTQGSGAGSLVASLGALTIAVVGAVLVI